MSSSTNHFKRFFSSYLKRPGKVLALFALIQFYIAGAFVQAQFAGGDGSSGDPYQIDSVEGLNEIRNDLGAHYILVADIDITTATGNASGAYWNGGEGWEPIGTNANRFTGSIDGDGYTITGLFIDRPGQDFIGFFGETNNSAEVKNLGLLNVSILEGGPNFVGGLVGRNWGNITNSYTTGSVKGDGGLAASNSGTITNSYSTVSVNGSSKPFGGGLVGQNAGTITTSYATGSVVNGVFYVGGLVGQNAGTINNSYATGSVSASSVVGGLTGENYGTINTSYWNTETSGTITGVGDGNADGVTGLTSEQMRDRDNFTGFNFTTTWQIESGPWLSYPYLQEITYDEPGTEPEVNPIPGLFTYSPDENNILFVDQNVSGGDGSGNSWDNAIPELRDVLAWAGENWDSDADGTLQIWVADGTYLPTDGTDREASFKMINHVEVYGGFAGGEDPDSFDLADRDFDANETVLSADIGVAEDDSDNAYHVFYHNDIGLDETAVLDGVTISEGRADGVGLNLYGAGMFNKNSSPTLNNVVFKNNYSHHDYNPVYGGGMYNDNSGPVITNAIFTGNEAQYGGGMMNRYGSNPTLTNVTFQANEATFGGAMYNHTSNPTLINVLISGNDAVQRGGGMLNYNSDPTLTNVTISGNSKGGMANTGGSYPILKNSIVWGNAEADVQDLSGGPFGTNSTTIQHSIVGGLDDQDNGNIDEDPLFMDPISADSAPTTAGDYRLQAGSPAISAGDNDALPDGITSDLAGNPRIDAVIVDMGAYEFQGADVPVIPDDANILYVDQNVDGGNETGSSWTNALPELRDALAWAHDWDGDADGTLQIWVAEGTYLPTEDGSTRTATFQLVNQVEIYGGFDPDGGADEFGERDWNENLTILSGDIGGDDTTTDGVVTDTDNIIGSNSYHVVNSSGTDDSAVLDGFTITAGLANEFPENYGAGLLNDEGAPVLAHLAITGNFANYGGGIYIRGSSTTLTNVLFTANHAENTGGGLYIARNSAPVLTAVVVSGNSAGQGGGMYNSSSDPVLAGGLFEGNSASYGGGMFNLASSPILTNVTLTGNTAGNDGGGMFNSGDEFIEESTPALRNVLIWGNSADGDSETTSASIYNIDATPAISHSLIANAFEGDTWETDLGTNGGNNLDTDPQFVNAGDPDGADNTFGTDDDGLALQNTSLAINAGDNDAVPGGITTDLAGNPRFFDGGTVDMGAYEFQGEPDEVPQGEDKRLLVGNDQPYVFSGSDFNLSSAVETVRMIGFTGFGDLEWDGSDVGYSDEIPAEQITEGELTFSPSESVAYGYNYAEVRFQLIDNVGRESESARLDIDVAAASVDLTIENEGWRFMASPGDGETVGDLFGPIWTQGFSGSDSPGANFANIQQLNQQEYVWEPVESDGSELNTGDAVIAYVYGDDDNNGSDDGFPKTLSSSTDNWLDLDGSYEESFFYDPDQQDTDNSFYLWGNPHPVAIDLCQADLQYISENAYFWDPAANGGNGGYENLSCDGDDDVEIAPFQSVWLRLTDANNSMELPAGTYLEGTTDGYFKDDKPSERSKRSDGFLITLNVNSEAQQEESFTNTTRILFHDEASTGSDLIDAPKLSSAGLAQNYLSLNSLDEENNSYALQALPTAMGDKIRIPLDIQTTESGRFTLDWNLPDAHIFSGSYYLRDNQTGEVIELREGSSYSFEIMEETATKVSGEERSAKFPKNFADLGMAATQPSDRSKRSDGLEPRFELLIAASGVDGLTELGAVPEDFTLAQNYPNPFNPTTQISYELPQTTEVRLEVYDMLGRNVATLVNEQVSAGRYTVNFDAGSLSSGVYLYRLQAGSQIITKKLTILK